MTASARLAWHAFVCCAAPPGDMPLPVQAAPVCAVVSWRSWKAVCTGVASLAVAAGSIGVTVGNVPWPCASLPADCLLRRTAVETTCT